MAISVGPRTLRLFRSENLAIDEPSTTQRVMSSGQATTRSPNSTPKTAEMGRPA